MGATRFDTRATPLLISGYQMTGLARPYQRAFHFQEQTAPS